VEPLINEKIPVTDSLAALMNRKKVSTKIATYYAEFKEFLLNK
jgi:hypothetical protein